MNPAQSGADDTPSSDSPVAVGAAGELAGRGILRTTIAGTAVFTVLGVAAALVPDALTAPYLALSLFEFFVGIVVFILAFLRAVDRSRTEAIGIGGLFFASGSAPKRVQAVFLVSLAVQVVVSVVVASFHLYTGLAFGVLAPMWALGFTGLWVAAYGTFPDRAPEPTMAARRDAARQAHRDSAAKKSVNDQE